MDINRTIVSNVGALALHNTIWIPEGGKEVGGGGGGGIDPVSWKIKWPFHIYTRTINSAFHVSREKKKKLFYTITFSYFG